MTATQPVLEQSVVDDVQRRCFAVSHSKGFHRTDSLRDAIYAALNENLSDDEHTLIDRIATLLGADWEQMQHAKRLLLIVGEVSEAFEELRAGHAPTEVYEKNGKPEGVPVELADVQIRLWDLADTMGFSLQGEVQRKEAFNRSREYMHGKKF